MVIDERVTLLFCAFTQFLIRSPFLCRKRTGQWVGFLFVVHSYLLWRIMAFPLVRGNFGPGLISGASLLCSQLTLC